MNVESTLKDEFFRPIAITIIPGALATGPFTLIAEHYVHQIAPFRDAHPNAFVAILAIVVIAAGFICEDIGSEIEVGVLDPWLKKHDFGFESRWNDYLRATPDERNVGRKYLRNLMLRFKFELSMIPAIFALLFGLTWLNFVYLYISWRGLVFLNMFLVMLECFLCYEAAQGAKLLNDVREQILQSTQKPATGN